MLYLPSFRHQAQSLSAALVLLICAAAADGADTYSGGQLSIPTLSIGNGTYSNVVVTVGKPVGGPVGTAPNGSEDIYDPSTNLLTVQSVVDGGATYFNVVVPVTGLISIGGVTGVDTYDGGLQVTIPSIQVLGGRVYTNVVVTVSQIVSPGNNELPSNIRDVYDPVANELTIASIYFDGKVRTNAVIKAGARSSQLNSPVFDTVLHSFSGDGGISGSWDGAEPRAGVVQGSDGSLYGTTYYGGRYNEGSIFRITADGGQTELYSFSGDNGILGSTDGAGPLTLIQGSDGLLYGVTQSGGKYRVGTFFSVNPAVTPAVVTQIHSFGQTGTQDGAIPFGITEIGGGDFLVTTYSGGTYAVGAVVQVSAQGGLTVIYPFSGQGGISGSTDGARPVGSLVLGTDSYWYGVTQFGGKYNWGTVYKFKGGGGYIQLYSFTGGQVGSTDGAEPTGGLTLAHDGNLYGTTSLGGVHGAGTIGEGVVFQVTNAGNETVIYSFTGCTEGYCGVTGSTDGAVPGAGVIEGSDLYLYGTTTAGGVNGAGTVFRISQANEDTVVYSFGTGSAGTLDANGPIGLIQGTDGNFYGTSEGGGEHAYGTVFSLTNAVLAP
jgi:uncharacterized repeat protein (TIGR03803 family)